MSLNQVPSPTRLRRMGAATVLSVSLLLTAACSGLPPQTSRPYTPADGVNADVGSPDNPRNLLRLRNLTIVSSKAGEGVLAGSMTSDAPDSMVSVGGRAIKVDGSAGADLEAPLSAPVPVGGGLTVLTANPISVRSADLAPGLSAELTLQFQSAGEVKLRVTVVDGSAPQYSGLMPTAEASGSATTTSMSPEPSSSTTASAAPTGAASPSPTG